nr:MAG TPA: PBCV-1 capsid-measure protein, minor capsid proteins.5A [Bacteriophage sp.]
MQTNRVRRADQRRGTVTRKRAVPRKRMPAMDKYVIFSIMAILIYTVVAIVLFTFWQVEMDTLTTCFYGFFGGEVFSLALIKVFKLKRG